MRRRDRLAALALVVLAWNAALVAAPAAIAPRLAAITYLAGSLVCHQQPDRSFHLDGAQFPVCARCLGLYAGGLLGIAIWVMFAGFGNTARPRAARMLATNTPRALLIAAAIPTLATVVLAWARVSDGSNVLRAFLAVPLGAVITAVVAAVVARDLR